MGGIFHHDGPLYGFLSKLCDMVILNLLMLVSCLPIVTVGAALTAGYYAAIRSIRGEGRIARDFWRSFRENLKQATILWLLWLLAVGGGIAAVWLWGQQLGVFGVLLLALVILLAPVGLWLFPVLAKFADTTGRILRSGLILCYRHLFRTLAMALSWLIPAAILLLSLYALPGVVLLGIAVPMFLCAALANRVFLKLEEQIRQQSAES